MAKTITMFGGLGLSASIAVKQRAGTAVDTQAASEIASGIYKASFTGLADGTYLVNLVDSSGDINWADVVVVGSADTDYYSKELDNIAESTYAYFVADANEDAFKADISSIGLTLVNISDNINNLSSQHGTIEGAVEDIQTRLPAILESGRMAAGVDATTINSIADGILKRNVSNVEATAGEHTLATAVLSMLEWEISGSNLIIKRTDGTTVHYTKVLSSATGTGDVITGLN